MPALCCCLCKSQPASQLARQPADQNQTSGQGWELSTKTWHDVLHMAWHGCVQQTASRTGEAACRQSGQTEAVPRAAAETAAPLTCCDLVLQGLYRDGLMSMPDTALGAINLFIRLAVGSRTLFWLVLACGYQLPLHFQVRAGCLVIY